MAIFIIAPKIYGAWQVDSSFAYGTKILNISSEEDTITQESNKTSEDYQSQKLFVIQMKQKLFRLGN